MRAAGVMASTVPTPGTGPRSIRRAALHNIWVRLIPLIGPRPS